MNNTHVMIALVAAIAVAASAVVVINMTSEPDVTVYTDEGVSAEVSKNSIGQVVLTATVEDGYTFGGWYDSGWNLLSDSSTYTAFMSGVSVYAFTTSYTVVDVDTAFDAAEALDVSGNGTLKVGASDEDGTEATVDGTTVTLSAVGLYRVSYSDPDTGTYVCHAFLGDEDRSITYNWTYSASATPNPLHFKSKTTSGDFSLTVSVSYADYRHYVEIYDKDDRYSYYSNEEDTEENIIRDVSFVSYDSVQDTYLKQIASYIEKKTAGKSDQYVANVILSFVQSIEYAYDSDVYGTSEYWQFPLETLYLGTGDCEDTSILFCAIAEYMGYDTALYLFSGHMAAGINLSSFSAPNRTSSSIYSGAYGWKLETGTDEDGEAVTKPFYYGETTSTGWLIGEIPSDIYSKYIRGFVVGLYQEESAGSEVTVVTSGNITATAAAGSGSTTVLTAKVPKGTTFLGWYDSYGNLLSTSTKFSKTFPAGTTVYAFAGTAANADTPVPAGKPVDLSAVTGVSGSGVWHVVNDDADAPDSMYTFGSAGRFIVSFTGDGEKWYGLVFVHADVTVYTAEGISVTVTSDGLQTTISADVKEGVEFNGIYADGTLLSETTSYTGDIQDGAVIYVFSDERVNGDVRPGISDQVDLAEVTGLTGGGTWSMKTSSFGEIPDGNLSGSVFTVYSLGTFIVLYDEDDTHVCGLLTADLSGNFMLFDVKGKVKGTSVEGQIGSYYYLKDYSRNAYLMKQTYSWEGGASGSSFLWTDEDDTTGYTETNTGTKTITDKDGTEHLCNVWSIQYYNSDGNHVYETQYIDAEQGFPVYAIEVSYFSGWSTTSLKYTLNDFGHFEADDSWSLKYYADIGVSIDLDPAESFGDGYTVTAKLDEGASFLGWYDGTGSCVSTELSYSSTAAGETVLYAFTQKVTALPMNTETDADEFFGVSGYEWYFLDSFPDASPEHLTDGKFSITEQGQYIIIGESDDGNVVARISSGVSWTYNGKTYTMPLNIDYEDYYHYATMNTDGRVFNTGVTKNASSAIKEAYNEKCRTFVHADDVQNDVMEQIAQFVRTNTEGLGDQAVADFILGMCQSSSSGEGVMIKYVYDDDSHGQSEYFQYPLETLYLRTGDCEDTAILYCAIASYMGLDVCMYLFSNHIAAGVYLEEFTPSSTVSSSIYKGVYYLSDDEKPYYYCETTGKNWHVGDVWKEEAEKYYYWEIPVGEY